MAVVVGGCVGGAGVVVGGGGGIVSIVGGVGIVGVVGFAGGDGGGSAVIVIVIVAIVVVVVVVGGLSVPASPNAMHDSSSISKCIKSSSTPRPLLQPHGRTSKICGMACVSVASLPSSSASWDRTALSVSALPSTLCGFKVVGLWGCEVAGL